MEEAYQWSRARRGWAIVTLIVALVYALGAGGSFFFVQGRQFLAIMPPMPPWLLAILGMHAVVAAALAAGAVGCLLRRNWAAQTLSIAGGAFAVLAVLWTIGMLIYAGITIDAIHRASTARGENGSGTDAYFERGLQTQRELSLESVLPYAVPQMVYGVFLCSFYRRKRR
ncbi:MAG: hypothetical protein LC772_03160 [Chloroflexi bacterium]|nr:hypothetical protein [Chloroflexota bacterium]